MAPMRLPKIAVVTSREVGVPNLSALPGAFRVAVSCETGIRKALEGADIVFLWDEDQIQAIRENWDCMGSVSWMHVAVTGVDSILFDELRRSAITITNAGDIYNYAIAEYVVSAVINYERNFPRLRYQKERHQWKPFVSSSCQGKNALIIGPGRIGRTCARSLKSLGMNVRGVGRTERTGDTDFECVYSFYDLEDVVGWAHHVIVTAPLTPETYHLINTRILNACRRKAHLINVGRGPIVKTSDLVFALKQNVIGGATLDVFEEEPLDELSPLWDMSTVTITPHIAGEVSGFEKALIEQFVQNALNWIRHEPLEYIVDKALGFSRK